MPNLTDVQWKLIADKTLKAFINHVAKKKWEDLEADEQDGLTSIKLTNQAWTALSEPEREKFLAGAQLNPVPPRYFEPIIKAFVARDFSSLTRDEKDALGIGEEKQWNCLTEDQRKALLGFSFIRDSLASASLKEALALHAQWTLPQPDRKALRRRP